MNRNLTAHTAMRFVVLLGVVSLFADMTYEGARSVTGPYLLILGASGTIVGLVAGLGELVGYAFRLVSGWISDRTGRYWFVTIGGYAINLFAVPLLALAGQWPVAAVLMIAERTGKAIRTPARDAMLSHATAEMGRGWGFGLHEAMDQIGATLGPLLIAAVLHAGHGYRGSFVFLLVPAAAALIVLSLARSQYPRPEDLETRPPALHTRGFPRRFRVYLAAVSLVGAGYADFSLIAYHFERASVLTADWIPIFYAVAMVVDAISALLFGRLFDRIGLPALAIVALITSAFAPLVFLGRFTLALLGMIAWGIGMGAQESIMRAAIPGMVDAGRRATAYGVLNLAFGVFWFGGSTLIGFLYDRSIPAVIAFCAATQLVAIPLFLIAHRQKETA